jgi:hypothetical protein
MAESMRDGDAVLRVVSGAVVRLWLEIWNMEQATSN